MRFSPPVNLHRNPDVACHVRSWEHNFEPHTDFDEDPVSWSDVPPVFNPNDCVEIALASPSTADKLKKALVKVCSSLQKYNHVADGIVELEAEGFIPRRHPLPYEILVDVLLRASNLRIFDVPKWDAPGTFSTVTCLQLGVGDPFSTIDVSIEPSFFKAFPNLDELWAGRLISRLAMQHLARPPLRFLNALIPSTDINNHVDDFESFLGGHPQVEDVALIVGDTDICSTKFSGRSYYSASEYELRRRSRPNVQTPHPPPNLTASRPREQLTHLTSLTIYFGYDLPSPYHRQPPDATKWLNVLNLMPALTCLRLSGWIWCYISAFETFLEALSPDVQLRKFDLRVWDITPEFLYLLAQRLPTLTALGISSFHHEHRWSQTQVPPISIVEAKGRKSMHVRLPA
jgi:hypothetical protein